MLLTGEYAVVDGAKSLALPTKLGQKLIITNQRSSDLSWKSFDYQNNCWFEAKISFYDFSVLKTTNDQQAEYLTKLFKEAVRLNSDFLSKWSGFKVQTKLDFPLKWGLGSSSTLTHLIAKWADINPLLLHFQVSNGSGYDVAAAGVDLPLVYQMEEDSVNFSEVDIDWPFSEHLYFVYLNRKQSSEAGLKYYLKNGKGRKQLAKDLTSITNEIIECSTLKSFEKLLKEHESLVSKSLMLSPMGKEFFSDYWGVIKSLGAWGGDFVIATSERGENETREYFYKKGYNTVLRFNDLFEFQAIPTKV